MQSSLRWIPQPAAPRDFIGAIYDLISPTLGQVLWARGLHDRASVQQFLQGEYLALPNPFGLRDMDRAVARVRTAVIEHETIALFGDFDADGITSVALLDQVLRALGLRVIPYIPRRSEGYGLNIPAIEQLSAQAAVLITVDCGISNVEEIARAQALGMDVIVIDHHTPPNVLPPALAVVNPLRPDCTYPFKSLAAVGLAYKFVQALYQAGVATPLRGRDLLDLVAIGTVSDQAALDGENRILVKHGLRALNNTHRPGLCALIDVAGCNRPLDADSIAFKLGPRINAAGRMDTPQIAFDLLRTDTFSQAHALAKQLDTLNKQRQALTPTIVQAACEHIARNKLEDAPVLVLAGNFHPGILGIAAAQLVEQLNRPVVLLTQEGDHCHGSARSVPGFSLVDAFHEVRDVLTKYGGHPAAAGCSLATDRLPEFQARLIASTQTTNIQHHTPHPIMYDGDVPLALFTMPFLEEMAQLEPFGKGHAAPLWVSRNVPVQQVRTTGKAGAHLRLMVGAGPHSFEAIWWGHGDQAQHLNGTSSLDLLYTVEHDRWRGRARVQLNVKDIAI